MADFTPKKPTLRFQLTFEGLWPTSVAFLGTGRKLAAANQRGEIFLWDLPETPPKFTPKAARDRKAPDVPPTRRLDGHTNEISHLVATKDGKTLISSSLDRTLRIWPIGGPAAGKTEVVLDSDTRRREARRRGKKEPEKTPGITVETQADSRVLEGHKDWIHALGMSADEKRLISGDAQAGVIVWDLQSGKSVTKWTGYTWNWIVAAALSPDGKTALVSEYRYKRDDFDIPAPALKLWDVETGKEKLDFLKTQFPKMKPELRTYGSAQIWRKFVANGLITAAYSPDGKLVAIGQGGETDTGKVHLLDTTSGKLVRSVAGHQYGVTDVMFSPDGKYTLSVGRDTTVRICQVSDGKEVQAIGSPRGGQFKDWLSSVALSPDNRYLAATDIAGLVHVWEFA